jgi:hypothetical protein
MSVNANITVVCKKKWTTGIQFPVAVGGKYGISGLDTLF